MIIALIPTYNRSGLLRKCLDYLNRLEPNFDKYIFFEDNSTDDTLKVIQEFNRPKELIRMWFRDDTVEQSGNPHEVIGLIRQYLLDKARKLNPNYAVFIDDDIIVFNETFIDQITSRKKDVVGAPYLRNFGEGTFLASRWKRKGLKGLWFKQSCQGFQEVAFTSTGCLCLSRKIIQDRRVNFLPIFWDDKLKIAEDFGYCKRAYNAGYKVYIDCTLKVGHFAEAVTDKPWQLKTDKSGYVHFQYK